MNKLNPILIALAVFAFVGWVTTNGFAVENDAPYANQHDEFYYGGGVSFGPMIEQNNAGVLSTSPRETGDTRPIVGQSAEDRYYGQATKWPAEGETIEHSRAGVLQTSPRESGGIDVVEGQFPEKAVADANLEANTPPCETIEQSHLGVLSTSPRESGDTSGMYSKLEGSDFCGLTPGTLGGSEEMDQTE